MADTVIEATLAALYQQRDAWRTQAERAQRDLNRARDEIGIVTARSTAFLARIHVLEQEQARLLALLSKIQHNLESGDYENSIDDIDDAVKGVAHDGP
ncbi:MAG: hypothetical protein NVS4B9_38850 [Ktedonobacteraceae bacterium]